jgi:hypothetical protein
MLTRRRLVHGRVEAPERGSVVMAMLVLMLLATLTGVAVDRVVEISHRTVAQRDRIAALESAEGALAVGAARIDVGETLPFTQSGALGAASYRVQATPTNSDNWVLRGTGTIRSVTETFTASLTRDRLYPFVLFTANGLQVSGPATKIQGPVGSAGAMRWTGLTARFEQHLVGKTATCRGCTNRLLDAPERTYPAAPRPDDANVQACPKGGVFTGAIDGRAGVPFRCEGDDVSFVDVVTVVKGPLVVWVGPGRSVAMAKASINQGGLARDFVLHKVDGSGEPVDLEGATIVGVIDMPATALRVTTLDLTGAIVAADLDDGGVGTDLIALQIDASIADSPGYAWWRIVDRRQVR